MGGRYLRGYLSGSLAEVVDRGKGRGDDHSLDSRALFLIDLIIAIVPIITT